MLMKGDHQEEGIDKQSNKGKRKAKQNSLLGLNL